MVEVLLVLVLLCLPRVVSRRESCACTKGAQSRRSGPVILAELMEEVVDVSLMGAQGRRWCPITTVAIMEVGPVVR